MELQSFILSHEASIRLSFFFGLLVLMGIWEWLAPKRPPSQSKPIRWLNNLGLVFLNSFVVRVLFPGAAVAMAVFVEEQGWGMLHYYDLAPMLSIIIAVILLDFTIYLQHVMAHAVPLLWRLHQVHHVDLDYDVTTGSRFHPLEIVFSMVVKFAIIVVLGVPVVAVIIFEVILNGMAMFNHGNVGLPKQLDGVMRFFVVTPDMHRVHHSVEDDETNSNFGFNLSLWDRICGTYLAQPRAGHDDMVIGLRGCREPKQAVSIWGMLLLPWTGKVAGYAINRRRWDGKG
jgi:sterol desaturase/sphingolipid hydroxylase (fatty acid hydroxylase superfamily)